jgi:hypothetical protein
VSHTRLTDRGCSHEESVIRTSYSSGVGTRVLIAGNDGHSVLADFNTEHTCSPGQEGRLLRHLQKGEVAAHRAGPMVIGHGLAAPTSRPATNECIDSPGGLRVETSWLKICPSPYGPPTG